MILVPGPAPEPSEPTQLQLVFDGEATERQECQDPMALKTVAKTPEGIARVIERTRRL